MITLLLLFVCGYVSCETIKSPIIDYVNPLFGTYGLGFGMGADPTGVQSPFGLIRLSPDTINEYSSYIELFHAGGFYFSDSYVRIFSHMHMVGAGITDYGVIGVMPYSINEWRMNLDYDLDLYDYNYKSKYVINKESRPGWFEIDLKNNEVKVELTSTKYVGVHKYKFYNQKKRGYILFYVSHNLMEDGGCKDAYVKIDVEKQEIVGYILLNGGLTERIGGLKVYFVARIDQKFNDFGVWNGKEGKVKLKQKEAQGIDIGAYISGISNIVELYVGVSIISIEQARKNLDYEVINSYPNGNIFESVSFDATQTWENELNVVQVTGGTEEQKRTFYSALYRTFSAPTLYSEVGGFYLGFDKQVHRLPDDSNGFYSDLSIWDVHRTQLPLLTLLKPDVMKDVIRSLLIMYEQGGDLPKWSIANGYGGCMIGQHALCVISDAFQKGIDDYNVTLAYLAMRQAATQTQEHAGRPIEAWDKYGFIPTETDRKSACLTLAFSYDDGCLSKMAKKLGKQKDYELFYNSSMGYKKVFSHESKFFCPKSIDGKFDCPKDYTDVFDERYVEGDAWHYRFFVPHDVEGLIEMFDSPEEFVKELEIFASREFEDPFTLLPNKYFWVGNEHNLLGPWLFNYAKRGDLTQKYIRQILKTFFNSSENGLPGNDDFGTISSWCIFGMLGFYPVAGSTSYSIGSPVFKTVKIETEKIVINIEMINYHEENIYVSQIEVGGVIHNTLFFDHILDFTHGPSVDIKFYMSNKPS